MPNSFARDKETFESHIRRGSEFSMPIRQQVPLSERVLHYVGRDRSVVCRCAAPEGHYLKTLPVSGDSEHLNASLILYMDRFGYESCKIAKFKTYQRGQKAMWQELGVHIDDFHYTNKEKDGVCRCANPGSHSYGAVRNPHIIELCAKLFQRNDDKCACNKQEWRRNYHQSRTESPETLSQSVGDFMQHSVVQEQGFSGFSRRSGNRGPSLWNGLDRGSVISASTRVGSPRSTFAPSIRESHCSHASQFDPFGPPQQRSVGTHSSWSQRDTSATDGASRYSTELSSTHSVHRHPASFQELESCIPIRRSDLPGRKTTTNTSRMERRTRLTSIFKQLPSIDGTLPNQEEFFLRYAVMSSRSSPAPRGECQVCKTRFRHGFQHMVMLPKCGHFLHEKCLLASFRVKDQEIGTCHVCSHEVCTRTLEDRIDTDRPAVFGSSVTQLRKAVTIEFPQYSQAVTCNSEEEVAAAQLRLLKDYIDVHAEELYDEWERTEEEPDWYAGVIRPVVKLFQGRSVIRESKFFAENGTFLELVTWAELVRLMNATRVAIMKMKGQNTPYPQLTTLHGLCKPIKDRFNTEKDKWPANHDGALGCDKVARDAIQIARDARAL